VVGPAGEVDAGAGVVEHPPVDDDAQGPVRRAGSARRPAGRGSTIVVWLPYGPINWTVVLLHLFWDSWIHERDVLLARGAEHPAVDDAPGYAAAYGVFISAAVASAFDDPVQGMVRLGGDGGGLFDLDSGGVTVTGSRQQTPGPCAAQVADALADRAHPAAVLGGLPASTRAALSHLLTSSTPPSSRARLRTQRSNDPRADHPFGRGIGGRAYRPDQRHIGGSRALAAASDCNAR